MLQEQQGGTSDWRAPLFVAIRNGVLPLFVPDVLVALCQGIGSGILVEERTFQAIIGLLGEVRAADDASHVDMYLQHSRSGICLFHCYSIISCLRINEGFIGLLTSESSYRSRC